MDLEASQGKTTEGSALERRIVLRVVEVLNLVFLAVDAAIYGAGAYRVVGGRLLVSAGLFAADRLLSARRQPPAFRWALAASLLAMVAGFALLASGSGGLSSPYLAFLGFVPIVLTIVIPDEPSLTLCTGAGTTATGLAFAVAAGVSPAQLAFTLAAFGSSTFYGTMSALLYRRMRQREAAAASAREQALAELARSERRRLEAERLAAVGQITAGLGHEVNNPLASALSNLAFVDQELARAGLDPEVAEALRDSKAALGRIRRLVVDLRVLTTERAGQPTEADLAAAVDRAVDLAKARLGPGTRADRRVPSHLPLVRASPDQLSQILFLLISSVGDRGGANEWQARSPPPSPFTISAAALGGAVRVVVEGGVGARPPGAGPVGAGSPAARPELEGVGLSIAVCRELAERWGGRIEATASTSGTRFALTLVSAPG